MIAPTSQEGGRQIHQGAVASVPTRTTTTATTMVPAAAVGNKNENGNANINNEMQLNLPAHGMVSNVSNVSVTTQSYPDEIHFGESHINMVHHHDILSDDLMIMNHSSSLYLNHPKSKPILPYFGSIISHIGVGPGVA